MISRFDLVTGISDHTLSNATAIASVATGASIVEKHFTIDRARGGPDDSFSIEPSELKNLCTDVTTAWEAIGSVKYSTKSSEESNIKFRRSLYFVRDLAADDLITDDSVRSVRPGYGLAPKLLEKVVGHRVTRDVKKNTPVTEEAITLKI